MTGIKKEYRFTAVAIFWDVTLGVCSPAAVY
jgi:hypothetical protein